MGNCANVEHDTCTSVERGEEPDMSLGDICVLCCCWNCERCDVLIDLDEENQIEDDQCGPAESGGWGYWVVCDGCLLDTDVLYDDELEAERREVGHPDVQVETTTIPSEPSTTGR